MTEDDLVSQLAMKLQINAMKEIDPLEDDEFISDARIAVEFLKEHYASVAINTGYYEGKIIAHLILGRCDLD